MPAIKAKSVAGSVVDEGLRQYMIKVYNYMAAGLCVTAASAYLTLYTPLFRLFFSFAPTGQITGMSAFGWLILFAPLVLIFAFGAVLNRGTAKQVIGAFAVFSAMMGMSISPVLAAYTGESTARIFLITAAMFGGMSLYGYTAKKDLTAIGSFLYMGVWGLVVASIVNIFMGSTGMGFAISILAVVIFTGLAAHDTQRIRQIYSEQDSSDTLTRKAVAGALSLYMDFVNLFLALLRLFGDRR